MYNPLSNLPFPIPTFSNNPHQVDGTAQPTSQRISNSINKLFMPNNSNINSFLANNNCNKTPTVFLYINNRWLWL